VDRYRCGRADSRIRLAGFRATRRLWFAAETLSRTRLSKNAFKTSRGRVRRRSRRLLVCKRPRKKQDLVAALANSCNVYFLRIAETLNHAALDLNCMSYGLAPPSRSWPASRLIGLGQGWPQTPLVVVRAFDWLARDADEPRTRLVLAGMLRCSESGTAKGIGLPCYAKTGTAAPSRRRDSGDGYVVSIYPVEQPRTVLLFCRQNTTGAEAAKELRPLILSLG
jgi:cell division protein FtsI/penicillin-binding protein 2